MRDLILKMSISLDGFVSDSAGTNTWMFGNDQEAKAWSVETLWSAGLHIMGSRTFRSMAAQWPTSTDQFAPPMNEVPKAVFSRRGASILGAEKTSAAVGEAQAGAVSWSTPYVLDGDFGEEIARLKAQDGKPIVAHGGVSFATSLVAERLVDQFTLLVMPVALGSGLPLFAELATPMPLRLVDSTAFPGGATAQIYRPA